jgi:hypothetical protein
LEFELNLKTKTRNDVGTDHGSSVRPVWLAPFLRHGSPVSLVGAIFCVTAVANGAIQLNSPTIGCRTTFHSSFRFVWCDRQQVLLVE